MSPLPKLDAAPPRWPLPALEPLGAWAVALALFLGSLALQLEIESLGHASPFVAFLPAVLLAAWLCGRAQGLAVTAASAAAAWWFQLRSPGVLAWPSPVQWAALLLFCASGAFAAAVLPGLSRAAIAARGAAARAAAGLAAQRVMAAELQHRVANNLQMVSSALTLQARQHRGTAAGEALTEATRRLDALGRLSRALIRMDQPRDPGAILEEVARMQIEASGRTGIVLAVDAPPDLPLDGERLTMLGMIVSEAISNALKHAFAARAVGRIAIRLRRLEGGRLSLSVRDDGVGLPPGFVWEEGGTLGLRIVQSMVQRLHGTLSFGSEPGVTLRVIFPEAADDPA